MTDQWVVKTGDLLPEGSVLVVENGEHIGNSAIFIRASFETCPEHAVPLDDGSAVLAYLNVCTHMGCKLVRQSNETLLDYDPCSSPTMVLGPCPCHGTTFDLAKCGRVLFGPATQSLPPLQLDKQGDEITARLANPDSAPFMESWPNE